MTRTGKRLAAVFLAVAVAACFLAFTPVTANANTSGDYEYTLSNGKITITNYTGSDATVSVPSSIDGYTVTSIGYGAFLENTRIKNVTIPSSVNHIDNSAFRGCPNLQSVTILASITELEDSVFESCTSLTNVILPDSLTTIKGAFYCCSSLASITIPDNVTIIGSMAFCCCGSLKDIELPDGLEKIGSLAFSGCGFTSFEVPAGVWSIGNKAFSNCDNLTSLSIPSGIIYIGSQVLENCSRFTDVFFWGTESKWQELLNGDAFYGEDRIESDNDVLKSATVHYNYTPAGYHTIQFSCAVKPIVMPNKQIIRNGRTVKIPDDPECVYKVYDGTDYITYTYLFGGWYEDEACTRAYSFGTPVSGDITIYAKILAQIQFNANGHGTAPDTQTVKYGDKAQKPAAPQADGWKFDGWYTDANCTSKYDFNTAVTDPMTLYAKWSESTIVDISTCTIDSISAKTYTGSAIKPEPKVTLEGETLVKNTDYTVSYKNNINVGTATVTITGIGNYSGTAIKTFTINKAANPLTMKAKTATVKYNKLKKKAQTLAVTKVINFTKDAKDKKTYTLSSAKKGKKSFKKYFKINKSIGKVTVKKGLKKGTYKVKVIVKAAGNANYKASAVKTVTFTVKVK